MIILSFNRESRMFNLEVLFLRSLPPNSGIEIQETTLVKKEFTLPHFNSLLLSHLLMLIFSSFTLLGFYTWALSSKGFSKQVTSASPPSGTLSSSISSRQSSLESSAKKTSFFGSIFSRREKEESKENRSVEAFLKPLSLREDEELVEKQEKLLEKSVSVLVDGYEKFIPTVSRLIYSIKLTLDKGDFYYKYLAIIFALIKEEQWTILRKLFEISPYTLYSLFLIYFYANASKSFAVDHKEKFLPLFKKTLLYSMFSQTSIFCSIVNTEPSKDSGIAHFLTLSLGEYFKIRLKTPTEQLDDNELRVLPTSISVIAFALIKPELLSRYFDEFGFENVLNYLETCGDLCHVFRNIPIVAEASDMSSIVLNSIAKKSSKTLKRIILSCTSFDSKDKIAKSLSIILKYVEGNHIRDLTTLSRNLCLYRKMDQEDQAKLRAVIEAGKFDNSTFDILDKVIKDDVTYLMKQNTQAKIFKLTTQTETIFFSVFMIFLRRCSPMERFFLEAKNVRLLFGIGLKNILNAHEAKDWSPIIDIILDYAEEYEKLEELIDAVMDYKDKIKSLNSNMLTF